MTEAIPDFTEPVVGWRGWVWSESEQKLDSTTRNVLWPYRDALEATCDLDIPPTLEWSFEGFREAEVAIRLRGLSAIETLRRGIVLVADAQGNLLYHVMGPPDAPPHREHACGIYALSSDALSKLPSIDVFGAVELTGKVIAGERGFRAQRARVVAIADPATLRTYPNVDLSRPVWSHLRRTSVEIATRAADLYDVPLVDVAELPETTDPATIGRET